MEYKVVLLPETINDLEISIEWYSAINSLLAKQFLLEIENTISFISKNPFLFQNVFKFYKSITTQKFPFKIIYSVDEVSIVIIAIFHHKRNPEILSYRTK